jgi:hypothetical protein
VTLDREDIEVLAARVVELLRESEAPDGRAARGELIDAAAVARRLGISRATVYAKANQLGAIRLGTGKRARLRFDPANLPTRAPEKERGKASRRQPGARLLTRATSSCCQFGEFPAPLDRGPEA